MHQLAQLAKEAVEQYILKRERITVPETMNEEFITARRGVFVCLKKEHQLRGCIGTFMPTAKSVAEETVKNAIAAAIDDPRFPPVLPDELDMLAYTVDVLSEPEEVSGMGELDPKKYGIIVVKDNRRGLLLPDLEGVSTVEQQIGITKMKAGILSDEGMKIFRFTVDRYQ